MRIAVASSARVGIPILEWALSTSHEVAFVLTNPDKKTGRGQALESNEFAKHALGLGLKVLMPHSSEELESAINLNPVDLVITVAYGRLIKKEPLSAPKFGWLNIHFSLLPAWRGAAPVQYAILNRNKVTGVSIFKLDEGLDTGPVYSTKSIPIKSDETTTDLLTRLSHEAVLMLPDVLQKIETGVAPSEQPREGVSLAPKLGKHDGKLNTSRSIEDLLAQIRALGENPGTYFTFRGARLGVIEARAATEADLSKLPAGELEKVTSSTPGTLFSTRDQLLIKVGDGLLALTAVWPAGKKKMTGADFARGARLIVGDICE